MDCSKEISAEHYVSKSILEVLGRDLFIEGFPQLQGKKIQIGINSVTANILCKRHNSSLSDLDAEAGRFFRSLLGLQSDSARKSLSSRHTVNLFSGEALELWMLKVASGLFYSKIGAHGGTKLLDTHRLDTNLIIDALYNGRWQSNYCGLYVIGKIGHAFRPINAVSIAPLLTNVTSTRMVGCTVVLRGMQYMVLFDAADVNPAQLYDEGWVHRPSQLLFPVQKRATSLVLTWLPGQETKCIKFDFRHRSGEAFGEV
jgi:hypothetical protein